MRSGTIWCFWMEHPVKPEEAADVYTPTSPICRECKACMKLNSEGVGARYRKDIVVQMEALAEGMRGVPFDLDERLDKIRLAAENLANSIAIYQAIRRS